MTTGEEIRALREALCLTQAHAATILGVSTRTLCRWETGEKAPTRPELRGVLEILREQKIPVKGEPRHSWLCQIHGEYSLGNPCPCMKAWIENR